jgi:GNAT superfamily N-acetyltransferase
VDRHQALYAAEAGFDDSFGPLVARILDAFATGHDPASEAGWIAQGRAGRLGSIFCMREDAATARLRLFLLEPAARGQGLGRQLLRNCMAFAQAAGYAGMTLSTHESHVAACTLYARCGWTLAASRPVHSFGQDLVHQDWKFRF